MAYAVRAVLGTTFNTSTGSHTVTATPAVNDLIVIVCGNTGLTTNPTVSDNNSDGKGSYTQVGGALFNTSASKAFIYIRTGGLIGSASSTVFTVTGVGSNGGGLSVLAITGIVTFEVLASMIKCVRLGTQYAKQENQAAGTPAPVFGSAVLTQDVVIGFVMNLTNPATLTQRSSPAYAEGFDVGYTVPTIGAEEMHIATGETATTITWGGASASVFCSQVVELNNNYVLRTTTGSFAESGNNAILLEGRKVFTATGAFTETGNVAILWRAIKVQAAAGIFSLTGNNAILTYSPVSGAYLLKTAAGVFVLTGSSGLLLEARKILVSTGSFGLTGSNARLLEGRKMLSAAGVYGLTGSNGILSKGRVVRGAAGSFAEAGSNVILLIARRILAGSGAYSVAGSWALMLLALRLMTNKGIFNLTGLNAILTQQSANVAGRVTGMDSNIWAVVGRDQSLWDIAEMDALVGDVAGGDQNLVGITGTNVLVGDVAGGDSDNG